MAFYTFDKNCHIKDELAYTEDEILIYNICIYNVPQKITKEEILTYFTRFGQVKSVRLIANKTRESAPKAGFIHYTDAASAARVLSKLHKLKKELIYVIACDSWLQPFVSESNADDDKIQEGKSFKITMLNDDCLEDIFKKLELKDQVRLAMTCQRFKNSFEMVCKTQYKNHRLEDLKQLTLWEIREFFFIFGSHIETLHGVAPRKYRNRIFEFIGQFCPNIKTADFNSNNFESSSSIKVLGKLQNCTVLELRHCYLKDDAIRVLNKLPNLQSLTVAENYSLTGEYMNRLTTVTDLVLFWCENIQPAHFAEVIKSLKDLKSLDIRFCKCLNTFSLSIMLDHSHKLECLKISCSIESYECITRLPSLKQLELLSLVTTELRQQIFEELFKHKANQLESLRIAAINCVRIGQAREIALLTNLKHLICENNNDLTDECLQKFTNLKNLEEIALRNCVSITNEGLLQLVQSCTNLKQVNIQRCTRITDPFVSKVIQVLKSTQSQRRKKACLFYVDGSGINSDMINNDEYIAAKGLLKLSFQERATSEFKNEFYHYCFYPASCYENNRGYEHDDIDSDDNDDYVDYKFFDSL